MAISCEATNVKPKFIDERVNLATISLDMYVKSILEKSLKIIPTSQISKKALLLMVENNLLGSLIYHMSSTRKLTMVILALNWEVWDTKSPAGQMATHNPEISKIKQNWNSTARPYDEGTFSPLDITAD